MTRQLIPSAMSESGVVAVLRADHADDYLHVCRTLIDAGIRALELTLTTPGTMVALPRLIAELPSASFGIGTVVDEDQARASADSGAEFLVTPVVRPDVLRAAAAAGVPLIGGAFSPTEVSDTWSAGASAVKIFPASTLGPDYVRHLAGPFPGLVTMPSGGIGLEDIGPWIRAGSAAVSLGGPLVGDALRGGDLGALRDRALRAVEEIRLARSTSR